MTNADWSGTSVLVSGAGNQLAYQGEWNGLTNFDCANGTVRFWFKPHWTSTNLGGPVRKGMGTF